MHLIIISTIILYTLFYFYSKRLSNNKIKYLTSLILSYISFIVIYIISGLISLKNGKDFDFLFIIKLNFIHIIIKILHCLYFNVFIDLSKKWYIHIVRILITLIYGVSLFIFMRAPLEKDLYYYIFGCAFYVLIVLEFLITFRKKEVVSS